MLHNELYVGCLVWNRLRYEKDPETGRRVSRVNAADTWIRQPVPELRLIEDSLWQRVQARLATIRETPGVQKLIASEFWRHRRPRHLLTSLGYCGCCGGALAVVGRDYLGCGTALRTGMCGNRRNLRRSHIEALILDALKRNLMAPDLVAEFVRGYHQEINRLRATADLGRDELKRARDALKRKIDQMLDAITDGFRSEGLQERLAAMESQLAGLDRELAAQPAPMPVLHPNLAELYRQQVESLAETFKDPNFDTEALEILRSLIDRVSVTPAGDGFEIELTGEIAAMVELAHGANNKKAGSKGPTFDDLSRRSVKVVAGA